MSQSASNFLPHLTLVLNERIETDESGGLAFRAPSESKKGEPLLKKADRVTMISLASTGRHIYITAPKVMRRMISLTSVDLPELPKGYPNIDLTGYTPEKVHEFSSIKMLQACREKAFAFEEILRKKKEEEEARLEALAALQQDESPATPASKNRKKKPQPIRKNDGSHGWMPPSQASKRKNGSIRI